MYRNTLNLKSQQRLKTNYWDYSETVSILMYTSKVLFKMRHFSFILE